MPSGTAVKNVDSPCKYGDVLVAARQRSTIVFDCVCNLLKNIEYEVYITVEDENGRGDGSVHSPIALMLRSNSFIHPPHIISPITLEGFLASFTPEASGLAWSVIVPQNYSVTMNTTMIKLGSFGIGTSKCAISSAVITKSVDHEKTYRE